MELLQFDTSTVEYILSKRSKAVPAVILKTSHNPHDIRTRDGKRNARIAAARDEAERATIEAARVQEEMATIEAARVQEEMAAMDAARVQEELDSRAEVGKAPTKPNKKQKKTKS
jgi:hypothetical protein